MPSLSIKEVISKVNSQADPSIGVVSDGSTHYLVLNKEDFLFNSDTIKQVNDHLDIIENAAAGPAVLVTIGTGQRKFSTGFDLAKWAEGPM